VISASTQSCSPELTTALQYSQRTTSLTGRSAPQLGQRPSSVGTPFFDLLPRLRRNDQTSS
jgi:hypothetical protein